MNNDEIQKWIANEVMHFHTNDLSQDFLIDRVIYWRLEEIACHLIKADTLWFESKIPILKQFWDYVLFYRENPKKLDRLVNYIKEIGHRNSAIIFERVHQDYSSVHKKTKYVALYQTETEWRKKYNEKYAGYQKFLDFKKKKTEFGQKDKSAFIKKKGNIDV